MEWKNWLQTLQTTKFKNKNKLGLLVFFFKYYEFIKECFTSEEDIDVLKECLYLEEMCSSQGILTSRKQRNGETVDHYLHV